MVHRQLQEVGLRPAWPWIVSTTAHSGWRAPMDTTKWKMNGEDRHTCQRIQDVAELTKRKLQVNVKSGLDKGCSSVRTRVYWLTKKQEGLQMKLESVPMERKTLNQAHVVLKTYIFQLLSASCHVPTDIQNILWSLPHDNSYSTHTPFPPTLYNDMRELFLNFFEINEIELESGQWDEKFVSLDCLQAFESSVLKKKRYQSLASARSMFMSKEGFHRCLRDAM
ncbi:hypothetical protein B9Z55_020928 [Caenorhabditis nigoni]|uniref:Uncharacterized protein n=1 Tax=Caenorhabditis nigoni TaxID=1611254 RepID=A0A2G5TPS7_9PELO|nr:hypothetical protein B9Z55_020928 [Caenorhabditis nigoni]